MRDEYEKLTEMLIDNPRVSLKKLSKETGLSYALIRKRIRSLIDRGFITFKPCMSPLLAGREVAIIRIRGNDVGRVLELASSCNRVLTGIKINDHEGILLISGITKTDIASRIDFFKSQVSHPVEISIEYGILAGNHIVVLRNHSSKCHLDLKCSDCIIVFTTKLLGNNRGDTGNKRFNNSR